MSEENNKLIAEFMGCKEQKDPTKRWFGQFFNTHGERIGGSSKEPLLYHTSWDWLMPVVDKCYQEHMSKHIADAVMTCDIDTTYKAVVEFIKWYNK